MDTGELEEKDERQHSDDRWAWRQVRVDPSNHDERIGETDVSDPMSPGRYNLAFILNNQRAPSSSPTVKPPMRTATAPTNADYEPSIRSSLVKTASPWFPQLRMNHSGSYEPHFPSSGTLAPSVRGAVPRPPEESESVFSQPQHVLRAEQKPVEDKKRGRTCKADGCNNYIVHKGLCCRHGGGRKCSVEGCETSAKHKGLCWKHGGSVQCKMSGCTKKAKAKGLCWAHGGGTKCTEDGCEKVAISNGSCWAHGGGKRCIYDGCNKPAYGRTNDFCSKHFTELQDVDYYEV